MIALCSLIALSSVCGFVASGPETPCGGQNGPHCHDGSDRGQNGPGGYMLTSGPDSSRCTQPDRFPSPGANGPSQSIA